MDPIVKVTNLSKTFHRGEKKTFYAVNALNFVLYSGEIYGIVGESGSGKSTIARLLTRQIDATTGKIEIDGTDITKLKGRQLIQIYAKLQMVFQMPKASFDPRRTLGDGICESLKNQGLAKAKREARALELLEQCGLSSAFFSRYPHEVSGGECQRAAIARALMNDPEILILDEPTSALDVTVQKQIMDLLMRLHQRKKRTYIFISHNLALVQHFCDRVMVLHKGKIEEKGDPDAVILHPKSPYTRRLVDSVLDFTE